VSTSKPLIAIVDDEPQVRKALRRLLSTHGYQVEEYSGGHAFMEAQAHHPADCLVLDLHMPEMSGFEVLASMQAGHQRTPVIVITANEENDTLDRTRSLGACAFLNKPVHQSSLLSALQSSLSHLP
jgi:FixJ family two-component response regulator